jgi:hypothetical protein
MSNVLKNHFSIVIGKSGAWDSLQSLRKSLEEIWRIVDARIPATTNETYRISQTANWGP